MLSRKIAVGAVAVGAVAVSLLGTTAANAAPPSAVNNTANGSSTAATIAVTGTGSIQFKNTTTGATANCPTVNLPGTAKVGNGLSPNGVATISPTSSSFGGANACKVAQLPFTITPSGTWGINAIAPSSPAHSGAPTSGQSTLIRLTGVAASVSSGSCTFNITGSGGASTGTVDPTYTNGSPSSISVPTSGSTITSAASTLVVSNLNITGPNCLGGAVTANGNAITVTSNTAVSVNPNNTAQRPLWVNALV